MPQLTFRGVKENTVAQASCVLPKVLSTIMECPEDYFTFDLLVIRSYAGGKAALTAPFLEILWFERGDLVRDQAAKVIEEEMVSLGVHDLEICFVSSEQKAYYSGGISFGVQ